MPDENALSVQLRAALATGVVLAVIGTIWWAWLLTSSGEANTSVAIGLREITTQTQPTTGSPTTGTQAERRQIIFSEPVLFDDDMGTLSTEFSAVTLNEETDRLVIADDEGRLFEFELDDSGVPVVPPRRTIIVEIGDSDIEGIAWISGNTYALAHETTGRLSIVEIEDEQVVVQEPDVRRTLDTQVREVNGNGIEGVSHVESVDGVEFIVAVERPPSLRFIDEEGAPTRTLPLWLRMGDVSDIWASPDGTVWVLSDTDRVVVRLEVRPDGSVNQLQRVDLVLAQGRFEQPEGIVISHDGDRLYVVGEAPGPGQFSLGFWLLS